MLSSLSCLKVGFRTLNSTSLVLGLKFVVPSYNTPPAPWLVRAERLQLVVQLHLPSFRIRVPTCVHSR